jgi:hypothetical protein
LSSVRVHSEPRVLKRSAAGCDGRWKRIFESFERAFQIDLVREIADALRREFGPDIDVDPGPAGAVNRAFRASTWIILETMASPSSDL